MSYTAKPFKVQLIWIDGYGIKKKNFRKYSEAVQWANKNLVTEEIYVKITGKIEKRSDE